MNPMLTKLVALAAVATVGGTSVAPAQSLNDLINRRQGKKNEWRNLGYAGAALGIYGLLRKDNTLFFAGSAGALYSAYRYEQDRKSQSRLQRARAAYFSRPSFYRDGRKYVRKTTVRNGKKYYYFVKR